MIKEGSEAIYVAKNLLKPDDLTKIDKSAIEEQEVTKVSAMPTGLVNILSKSEILDLLTFLETGAKLMVPTAATKKTK